ncbi:patatin [Candidimonas sp. SYP-B2681]|uniref:patatin-like phospholipase family protein n=1 Tax=Candidimonas sp. SYP-B2681 TaxID=2497686 RepID=UPI000F89A244|nr:patatin-like phospholipase family protein [Candidimonas sp. SYP-B2681]RTZ44656.1 patatin [Candidimonas sp. SYP-B2681]
MNSAQHRSPRKPRIGLVLGSGSARGWAHIGVIQVLEQAGIRPDIICGTSIGALVGAAYAVGELDRFEKWVLGLGIKDVVSFMDVRLNGGMLKGERLMEFFRRNFVDQPIDELEIPFGAVATVLHNGNEIWLRSGSTVDAVRASIALPGLFSPVWHEGQLLVDGGLVNPVPVSLARAMGADITIAVELNSDIMGRHTDRSPTPATTGTVGSEWMRKLQLNLSSFLPESIPPEQRLPSMLDVVAASINIMQVRITRSRLAGEPADIVISPKLAHLGLLDFHRAQVAMDEGRRAAQASIPGLIELGLAH